MPAIVRPRPERAGTNKDHHVSSSAELLSCISESWAVPGGLPEASRIMESSFSDLDAEVKSPFKLVPPVAYQNGFVMGILRAFQQDLHLVLRPDDVWLAIITQFSIYLNAVDVSEDLIPMFCLSKAHERKKELIIDLDKPNFTQQMAQSIQNKVNDGGLKNWMLPGFTTTSAEDKAVAAIVMAGTLQHYYGFTFVGNGCGFPSVTLQGERSDWENILRRVNRLLQYGKEAEEWNVLLKTVIKQMVLSFDQPDDPGTKDFWMQACHLVGSNGPNSQGTLSGWLTAFCFWKPGARRVHGYVEKELEGTYHNKEATYGPRSDQPRFFYDRKPLILDGVRFPMINVADIPPSVVTVPVILMNFKTRLEYSTTLVSGTFGMTATPVGPDLDQTYMQPRSGWLMLKDSKRPLPFPIGVSSSVMTRYSSF
jgi:hypothetical protein